MPIQKTPPSKRARAAPRPLNDPDRRSAILTSALTVFSEKGFHRTTIKDIAKAAGLAEGTIYNHFENKDALLLSLFEGLNARGREKVDLALPPDLPLSVFLPAHFEQMLSMFVESAGKALPVMLAELLTNNALRESYAQRIRQPTIKLGEQALQHWMATGRIRRKGNAVESGINNAITVRLIGALLLGTALQHLLGDEVLIKQWKKVPAAIADLVLTGIQPTLPSSPTVIQAQTNVKPAAIKKVSAVKKQRKK
jgi:AcrR family transcriptional regulator